MAFLQAAAATAKRAATATTERCKVAPNNGCAASPSGRYLWRSIELYELVLEVGRAAAATCWAVAGGWDKPAC